MVLVQRYDWPSHGLLLLAMWIGGGFVGSAQAQTEPQAVLAEIGVDAFRQNQLELARTKFLSALQAGGGDAKLYYNLGVVNYRLADYQQAQKYFWLATQYPQSRQIAHYNLARCAQQLNKFEAARHWYQQARQGPDSRLVSLAERAESAMLLQRRLPANLRVHAKLGFDSSVVGLVDQVSSLPTNTADLFTEIAAHFSFDLKRPSRDWGQLGISGQALTYDDQTQVNVQSASVSWSNAVSHWHWRSFIAHEWLDASSYQARVGGAAEYRYSWNSYLIRPFMSAEWLQEQAPEALVQRGGQLNLGVSVIRRLYAGFLLSRASVQWNERESEEQSPARALLDFYWKHNSTSSWSVNPGLQWRYSQFSSGREDEGRIRALLRLDGRLDEPSRGLLRVELQYEDNQSKDRRYAYQHTRLSIGFVWGLG